ncbi:MAG: type VI secretion system baseplate subunit TssF [Terriglobia bacterium]|jgi:type VI secretion system protein ImpG
MRDILLDYYENELTFLRQMGKEFAEKHPKIAARLQMDANRCDDPHVERLLEGFALLAARVHLKIDDEFPQITEGLLNILYPHFLRPIPSMTIAQFRLDREQGKLTTGLNIPRDSFLFSRPVDGVPCKFRSCYDVTLWPIEVGDARWVTPDKLNPPLRAPDAVAALRVELRCFSDVSFDKLQMSSLRFYLNGEGDVVNSLYELLSNNCRQIIVRDPDNPKKPAHTLTMKSLRPMGFAPTESVLPYPRRSFQGYRLLQEYFAFPEKFFFFELNDLEQPLKTVSGGRAEIIFLISPFEAEQRQQRLTVAVTAKAILLGCSPIINLFPQTAEPIMLTQRRSEYPVVPDARRRMATEIFSIEDVVSSDPVTHELTHYEPFYSYRHRTLKEKNQTFWYSTRRPSSRKGDEGSEVSVFLVDLSMQTCLPNTQVITAHCTCTNRDIVARLPFGSESGDFEVEGVGSLKGAVALRKPTPTLRPPMGRNALWRLISHLALNYLSLVEGGKEALQEVLRLYNFSDSADLDKQISGIAEVSSKRHFARINSDSGIAFARGTQVHLEFDEEDYSGGGVYLFASVIENFLGLYASLNSFSQLVVKTRQRRGVLKEWPPRAGQVILM